MKKILFAGFLILAAIVSVESVSAGHTAYASNHMDLEADPVSAYPNINFAFSSYDVAYDVGDTNLIGYLPNGDAVAALCIREEQDNANTPSGHGIYIYKTSDAWASSIQLHYAPESTNECSAGQWHIISDTNYGYIHNSHKTKYIYTNDGVSFTSVTLSDLNIGAGGLAYAPDGANFYIASNEQNQDDLLITHYDTTLNTQTDWDLNACMSTNKKVGGGHYDSVNNRLYYVNSNSGAIHYADLALNTCPYTGVSVPMQPYTPNYGVYYEAGNPVWILPYVDGGIFKFYKVTSVDNGATWTYNSIVGSAANEYQSAFGSMSYHNGEATIAYLTGYSSSVDGWAFHEYGDSYYRSPAIDYVNSKVLGWNEHSIFTVADLGGVKRSLTIEDYEDDTATPTYHPELYATQEQTTTSELVINAAQCGSSNCVKYDDTVTTQQTWVEVSHPTLESGWSFDLFVDSANGDFVNFLIRTLPHDDLSDVYVHLRVESDGPGLFRIVAEEDTGDLTIASGLNFDQKYRIALLDPGFLGRTYDVYIDYTFVGDAQSKTLYPIYPYQNRHGNLVIQSVSSSLFYVDNLVYGPRDEDLSYGFIPASTPVGSGGLVGQVSSDGSINLAWNIDLSDTNQDSGDFDYRVFIDGLSYQLDTKDVNDANGVRTANINPGGSVSIKVESDNKNLVNEYAFSCEIVLNANNLGESASCGTPYVSVPTATGHLSARTNYGQGTLLTSFAWGVSSSDPNQDTGSYDYEIYTDGSLLLVDTITSKDANGIRTKWSQDLGGSVTAKIVTRDSQTLFYSESCEIIISSAIALDFASCGIGAINPPSAVQGVYSERTDFYNWDLGQTYHDLVISAFHRSSEDTNADFTYKCVRGTAAIPSYEATAPLDYTFVDTTYKVIDCQHGNGPLLDIGVLSVDFQTNFYSDLSCLVDIESAKDTKLCGAAVSHPESSIPNKPNGIWARYFEGSPNYITIEFPVSGNDPDLSSGSFHYKIILTNGEVYDPLDAYDIDGIRRVTVNDGLNQNQILSVIAYNPLTAFSSEGSCAINLNNVDGAIALCGSSNSGDPALGGGQTPPSGGSTGGGIPTSGAGSGGFVDTQEDGVVNEFSTGISDGWGVSMDGAKWFLGIVLMLSIAVLVATRFNGVAAVFMGAIGAFSGLGLAVTLGILPVWFLIGTIMLVVVLVAKLVTPRGGNDGEG